MLKSEVTLPYLKQMNSKTIKLYMVHQIITNTILFVYIPTSLQDTWLQQSIKN